MQVFQYVACGLPNLQSLLNSHTLPSISSVINQERGPHTVSVFQRSSAKHHCSTNLFLVAFLCLSCRKVLHHLPLRRHWWQTRAGRPGRAVDGLSLSFSVSLLNKRQCHLCRMSLVLVLFLHPCTLARVASSKLLLGIRTAQRIQPLEFTSVFCFKAATRHRERSAPTPVSRLCQVAATACPAELKHA